MSADKKPDVYETFDRWCAGKIMHPVEAVAVDHTRRIIDLETRVANLEAALAKMEESK